MRYSLSILAGGTLWGFMGLFRRSLGDIGLSSPEIIVVRCLTATLCFGILLLVTNPEAFRIRWKDLWCFLGAGIISMLCFSLCYYQAMNLMSLSAAAILLYTAPCFVILLSAVLFHEALTRNMLLAMVLAFAGCALVSGIAGSGTGFTLPGLLCGLGAGFGYALYSIFGKLAMARGYSGRTLNFYACLFCLLGALLCCNGQHAGSLAFASVRNLAWCGATGIVTCFLPYLLYAYGLSGVPAGNASIMASVEPVVATLVGMIFYGETPDGFAVLGIVLVLSAIVLTNVRAAPKKSERKLQA